MKFLHLFLLILLLVLNQYNTSAQSKFKCPEKASWTVMVYMNGCNNLEGYAIDDFYEMAKVGSDERLNIIVQLRRCGKANRSKIGNWTGTRRFRVLKGMIPNEESATNLSFIESKDMAKIKTLENFISQVQKNCKADNFYLIIWDHGNYLKYSRRLADSQKDSITNSFFNGHFSFTNPKKQISFENFKESIVLTDEEYPVVISKKRNRVLSLNALRKAKIGHSLDIIGFDTCLTSNIETAYSVSNKADYMVASQDYIDASGWDYESLLNEIKNNKTISPKNLSVFTVKNYKNTYKGADNKTLSSINLLELENTIDQINLLCERIICLSNSEKKTMIDELKKVRSKCFSYENKKTAKGVSIDLFTFLEVLNLELKDTIVSNIYNNLLKSKKNLIINNFRTKNQNYEYVNRPIIGSKGISIYLPSKLEFLNYENSYKKLPFSSRSKWDDLYLNLSKINKLINSN